MNTLAEAHGKKCKAIGHGNQVIIDPKLDFNELLGDASVTACHTFGKSHRLLV
jgi:hypothetical protein